MSDRTTMAKAESVQELIAVSMSKILKQNNFDVYMNIAARRNHLFRCSEGLFW